MAGGTFTNAQKKEFAKTLYFTNKELSQKELAERVGINEKTLRTWIREGEWETLRVSLLTSKSDQVRRLYLILNNVTQKIEDEDGIGDPKLADMMIKYTAAIKNLETDTSVAELVDSCTRLLRFVQQNYPESTLLFTDITDSFVMQNLK